MVKTIAKIAEKTAKNANSSSGCWVFGVYHQPKMPASLVKKDNK
jgi:cyclic lactone autoinducer peptide